MQSVADQPHPTPRVDAHSVVLTGAAILACAAPATLAYSVPPSATLLNQLLACGAWGIFVWMLASRGSSAVSPRRLGRDLAPALGILVLVGVGMWVAAAWRGLPWSLGLSGLAMVACAAACVWAGARAAAQGKFAVAMTPFASGLLVAGLVSVLLACVQTFLPALADGTWVAAAALPGRAAGNLRQPNHLSTLTLWALIALVWLGTAWRWSMPVTGAIGSLLVLAVVLSGSRTGALGIGLMAAWGLLDKRRLPGRMRVLLVALPLIFAVQWVAVAHWGSHGSQALDGAGRFSTQGDVSSSRFAIWSDTLVLIARFPWFGVGYGEFNRAWSLSVMPHRPVAFFDHTHNLPLQFAVELGLPLALLISALAVWMLWRAWRSGSAASAERPLAVRVAFIIVLMAALHSMLEYPLWYSYFLLPFAYALGLCLGADAGDGDGTRTSPEIPFQEPPGKAPVLQLCGVLMLAGSIYAVSDYWKVVLIFQPGNATTSLAERIASGKRSVFFAHHANYAEATTALHPSQVMPAFREASYFLLDTRLMTAWAKAYAEAGDLGRARHLAARLREFRNEASRPFFAPCAEVAEHTSPAPFQCDKAATSVMDHRDFN